MSQERPSERPETPKKKPYSPPRVEETATFETLALNCGKNDPHVVPGCYAGQSAS